MNYCPSCGGIIGRDCFNPQECAWITQQMIADYAVHRELRRQQVEEYNWHCEREYGAYLEAQYEEYQASIGFDPIAMGM